MKTISILIQTESEDVDLWPLARRLAKLCDDQLIDDENTDQAVIKSWRTAYPAVLNTDLVTAISDQLKYEDK